jgi:hypothetical protein
MIIVEHLGAEATSEGPEPEATGDAAGPNAPLKDESSGGEASLEIEEDA